MVKLLMTKTIKLQLFWLKESTLIHFFEKIITSSKKYHAHDEMNKFKIGDKVKIVESKPFSKKKVWEVINK